MTKTKALLFGLIGGFVGVFAAMVLVAQYGDYRARAEASNWLIEIEAAQTAIAARALQQGTLAGSGEGVAMPAMQRGAPAFHRITTDGSILMRGKKDGQVVVLVPTLADGQVTWQCFGGSARDVAGWCSDPASPSRPTPEAR